MLAKWDAVIATIEKAAPLNPLFDDVARLRIARASLREVDVVLRAGDIARARTALTDFSGKLDSAKGVLKARSPEALDAVTSGAAQIQSELKSAKPDAAKAVSFIPGMMAKYNVVLAQVTAEARTQQQTAKH